MQVSFAKFILKYLDEWNISVGSLCDDLGISSHTLNDWTHRGQIPSLDSIEIIKNYFQEDLEGVVFDGRGFKRKFKVIRSDGSSQIYSTMQQIVWNEGISYTTIVRCLQEDIPVGRGKHKGYRFQRVYLEEECGHKVYLVNYYMDYGSHGLYAIFKNKEDAESCAKILTERDQDIGCRYDVCESIIYKSLDEALKE